MFYLFWLACRQRLLECCGMADKVQDPGTYIVMCIAMLYLFASRAE